MYTRMRAIMERISSGISFKKVKKGKGEIETLPPLFFHLSPFTFP
jgi:hypothetical protein